MEREERGEREDALILSDRRVNLNRNPPPRMLLLRQTDLRRRLRRDERNARTAKGNVRRGLRPCSKTATVFGGGFAGAGAVEGGGEAPLRAEGVALVAETGRRGGADGAGMDRVWSSRRAVDAVGTLGRRRRTASEGEHARVEESGKVRP
jgi:hypothetical protein